MNVEIFSPVGDPVLDLTAEIRSRNRILFGVVAVHIALVAVFTGLLVLDGRTVLGRNVWVKPWKFAASIAIFTATLGWLLPSLSLPDGKERFVSNSLSVAMVVEMTLITAQAARGVPSHFNTSTPLDTAVFSVMGATITFATLLVGYVLWRTVSDPPDLAPGYLWGIRLGLVVFLLASLEGGYMAARGSHAVGVSAGSAGLPLLNWKVDGGDLRVAHFVGLHALQVLPLTGYLAARRLDPGSSMLVVGAVGAVYASVTAAAFLLAVAGVPVAA